MFRKKKVLEVIRQNKNTLEFSDEEILTIFKEFSDLKCETSKIRVIDYFLLCNHAFHENYPKMCIIQGNKKLRYNQRFESSPHPCYQISPFQNALIIASLNDLTGEPVRIFKYEPAILKNPIYLNDLYELEPNFDLYNVFIKSYDTVVLVKNFEQLSPEDEVFCISKDSLTYNYCGCNLGFSIIIKYSPGSCFF